jgi:glycosyltransferase involved in cell wall biosynthesis
MHILLIHQAFAALDEPGGTRHHEIARFLAEQGNKVTVIASPVSYLTGSAGDQRNLWVDRQSGGDRIRILRAYTYPALHRSFVHRVISFFSFMISSFFIGLGVRDVDVIWGTSPPIFQGFTSWLLSRLKRVPFLFEVRDLWPAFAVAVGVLRQPILIRASEWLERFLYQGADQIVVNSPGFIDHVMARGAARVELIPNGADPDMFTPADDGQNFRTTHGLEGKFIALYAGAHGMSNDLEIVLGAAEHLRDMPEIAVVFLGDGKEKPGLMALASEMALSNVYFIASVPKRDMVGALAAADACIAILKPIQIYKTVFPNKVFDYMAAGRPVVLAIDGVIRQVVEDAHAGIAVEPGDTLALAEAIKELVRDPSRRKEMGANGRRCVETQFNRGKLAGHLLTLMEGLSDW